MNNPYYQSPSELGLPLLELLGVEIQRDCITTIEYGESVYGWNFCYCSVIKYLWRLGAKTKNANSDCYKIIDYIDRIIAREPGAYAQLSNTRDRVENLIRINLDA